MIYRFIMFAVAVAALSLGGLRSELEKISPDAKGRVGAAVVLLESGESVDLSGDEHFPMQSVYKLPIGIAVLRDIDGGRVKLDDDVRVEESDLVPPALHSPLRDAHPHGATLSVGELLRLMVSESDGTASDVLLKLAGGPSRVNAFLGELGVSGIVVATSEKEMAGGEMVQYRNWATPKAMVALLRALQEGRGLSASSRALILKLLTESSPGQHRLKGLLPVGTVVAHKTGTSNTARGLTRATNDVGIITLPDGRHLAVAVFVSDSTADEATRESVIARMAKAAWDWGTRLRHPS